MPPNEERRSHRSTGTGVPAHPSRPRDDHQGDGTPCLTCDLVAALLGRLRELEEMWGDDPLLTPPLGLHTEITSDRRAVGHHDPIIDALVRGIEDR